MKREQLERVARDWCLTVRASQVIPVYPLTEDLVPGDVFLVTTSVQNQADEYDKKGFLPLDVHLARLDGLNYSGMYDGNYNTSPASKIPQDWQFPSADANPPATTTISTTVTIPEQTVKVTDANKRETEFKTSRGSTQSTTVTTTSRHAWATAPSAFFPSYKFEVRSGQSLALAIPVHAVPIGLSVMNTDRAAGTVQFSDARTYGVPEDSLSPHVYAWSLDPLVKDRLAKLRARNYDTLYVRAISRVYLVSAVDVSLSADRASAIAAAGGMETTSAPSNPSTELTAGDASANFDRARQINAALQATPGGRVNFSWASSRGVSATEQFDRPLVLGYLAMDYPVLEGGVLGQPIATRKQLLDKADYTPHSAAPTQAQVLHETYLKLIEAMPAPLRNQTLIDAATALGDDFKAAFERAQTPDGGNLPPFNAFTSTFLSLRAKSTERSQFDLKVSDALRESWRKNRAL